MRERSIPRYRLVYPVFWMDPAVITLTLEEKGVALYCLTGLQTNRIGLYKLSLGEAAEDLNIKIDSMKRKFATVIKNLEWKYDTVARVLFIPSWWTWNPAQNPNVMKGNLTDLDEVPFTYLFDDFLKAGIENNSGNILETFRVTSTKRWGKRFDKPLGNKTPNQEQEQEQEQEQKQKLFVQKGQENFYKSAKRKILKGKILERFEKFLDAFGSRAGKAAAADPWLKLNPMSDELFAEIVAGAKRYDTLRASIRQKGGTPKMAQGWLTDRRWEDPVERPTHGRTGQLINQRQLSEYTGEE